MKVLILILSVVLMACSSYPDKPCDSYECWREDKRSELVRQCINTLQWETISNPRFTVWPYNDPVYQIQWCREWADKRTI